MSAEIIFIPYAVTQLIGLAAGLLAAHSAAGAACSVLPRGKGEGPSHEQEVVGTGFTDGDLLQEALGDLGYEIRTFERGFTAVKGKGSIDFLATESGSYQMVAPGKSGSAALLEKITGAYKKRCQQRMHRHVVETLKKKRYQVVEEKTDERGNIVITLRSWK